MNSTLDTSSAAAPPPSRGSVRFAVLALAATCFAMSLNANVFAALNPYLRESYGFDDDRLGLLVAAAGLAGAIGALLLGPLVDRLGRRPMLLVGTVVFLLASLGYLVADSFLELLVVRLGSGFVAGVVLTSASAAVADLVPYERRGAAMGIVTASILLAVPVGMPAAIALAERTGDWRSIFIAQVVAASITLIGLWRTQVSAKPPADRADSGDASAESRSKEKTGGGQLAVLRQPSVVEALVSVALYTGAFFATVQFLGGWLHETGELDKSAQGPMWIVLGLVAAAGSAVLGKLADKVGKRRYVLWATGAVAIGLAAMSTVEGLWLVTAIGIPVGVLSASRGAALLALVSDLVPAESRGTLMGLRSAAVNLGTGTVPVIAGYVIDARGFPSFLLVAAGIVAVAWALVLLGVAERSVAVSSSDAS